MRETALATRLSGGSARACARKAARRQKRPESKKANTRQKAGRQAEKQAGRQALNFMGSTEIDEKLRNSWGGLVWP